MRECKLKYALLGQETWFIKTYLSASLTALKTKDLAATSTGLSSLFRLYAEDAIGFGRAT